MSPRSFRRAARREETRRAKRALTAGATVGAALALAPTAEAADFTVMNNADAGGGSLRQAVLDSNAAAGPDRILFAPSITGTIALTTGELDIYDPVEIAGPGAGALSISGSNVSRIFNIEANGPEDTFEISGLRLTDGEQLGSGGAMRALRGDLTLSRVTVDGSNTTGTSALGGGIFLADGSARIEDSTISGNTSEGIGGGVVTYYTALSISDSTISGNSAKDGGGITDIAANLKISNTTISGNVARGVVVDSRSPAAGAGILSYRGQSMKIDSTTITNNIAEEGNDPIATGTGGGITSVFGVPPVLRNSIVAGNSAAKNPDLDANGQPWGSSPPTA